MSLRPLEDRVIVLPDPPEKTTAGGLIIPDAAQEKPQQGTVIAVGPGRTADSGELVPTGINQGDTVVYSRYGGTEITIGEDDLLIIPARDILAVVEPDAV